MTCLSSRYSYTEDTDVASSETEYLTDPVVKPKVFRTAETVSSVVPRSEKTSDATWDTTRRPMRFWTSSGNPFFVRLPVETEAVVSTVEKIGKLLLLGENWDSYGAPPIKLNHVMAILNIIPEVAQVKLPEPAVVPTSRGGVQLEWNLKNVGLEIETVASDRFSVFFEDLKKKTCFEKEVGWDLSSLKQLLISASRLNEETVDHA